MTEGAEYTVEQTLDMARAEGVVLSHRMGRINARGASDELGLAIVQNERVLIAHLGGSFYSDPLDNNPPNGARRRW